MHRSLLSYLILLVMLAGATTVQHRFSSPSLVRYELNDGQSSDSDSHRSVFLLQYLASDYDRAVQNGQITDSLEYGEMQRFARSVIASYRSSEGAKAQTLNGLHALEGLIADKASLQKVRTVCKEMEAAFITEKNLLVFPQVAPDLANGQALFLENCVSCHGLHGAGDGPSADTLNPKPRDFTDSQRLKTIAPHQLFQAITFGVEGTAMPSFAEAFTAAQRWDLAFHLMTLRRDFHPLASEVKQEFTLQQLATKDNLELAAILSHQVRSAGREPALDLNHFVDFCRKNPPQLTMEEHLAMVERMLLQSLAAYLRTDSVRAIQFAEEAYWQGFEPIERKLRSVVNNQFERAHTEYHWCIEEPGHAQQARALVKAMLEILHQIRDKREALRS